MWKTKQGKSKRPKTNFFLLINLYISFLSYKAPSEEVIFTVTGDKLLNKLQHYPGSLQIFQSLNLNVIFSAICLLIHIKELCTIIISISLCCFASNIKWTFQIQNEGSQVSSAFYLWKIALIKKNPDRRETVKICR